MGLSMPCELTCARRNHHNSDKRTWCIEPQQNVTESSLKTRTELYRTLFDGILHTFNKKSNFFCLRLPHASGNPFGLYEHDCRFRGVKICCVNTIVIPSIPHSFSGLLFSTTSLQVDGERR